MTHFAAVLSSSPTCGRDDTATSRASSAFRRCAAPARRSRPRGGGLCFDKSANQRLRHPPASLSCSIRRLIIPRTTSANECITRALFDRRCWLSAIVISLERLGRNRVDSVQLTIQPSAIFSGQPNSGVSRVMACGVVTIRRCRGFSSPLCLSSSPLARSARSAPGRSVRPGR